MYWSYRQRKIGGLALRGNCSKSLWDFLSGASESNWYTMCLPDCQRLSPLIVALCNFIQVDIKLVFYNWQPLCYTKDLKFNLPKSRYTQDNCMCFHVSCLFCKHSPLRALLAPAKESCLIDFSRALPMFPECAQRGWMMYGRAVCHKALLFYQENSSAFLKLGVGREGWTGEQGKGWNGGPDWVLWKPVITNHESCRNYRAKRLDEQSP